VTIAIVARNTTTIKQSLIISKYVYIYSAQHSTAHITNYVFNLHYEYRHFMITKIK